MTCKQCLHYNACEHIVETFKDILNPSHAHGCPCFEENIKNKWIPLSEDNLPVIYEEVLVTTDGLVRVYSINEYQGVLYWIDEHGIWLDFEDVEAWMPLSEPYKGE